ncbi:MAG: phenylphosphate carboxylase subunit delta [Gammaproteobacteria bacterium]|nr:phenylphosphate carboxylase subunit delta [Gammaproteobacteria bacterium]
MSIIHPELIARIQQIRCLTFDVEGILTLQYRSLQPPFSTDLFSQNDREGLIDLINQGFIVGIISSSESKLLQHLLQELHIPFIYLGAKDKRIGYEEIKQAMNLTDMECAHMGDGERDIPLLEKVGLAITVPHASSVIKEKSHYCTSHDGGWGAVGEVAYLMRRYQRELH